MQRVTLKSAPDVKRVVLSAFPSYRKHDVFLSVFGEHGVNINSYWDGGSKSTYVVVDMATGKRHALPAHSHPYWEIARNGLANRETPDVVTDHVGNVTLKRLPEGFALVEGGTFCGKPATVHVYVPSENMARLIGGTV